MSDYVLPGFGFVPNRGGLSMEEAARLSDEELAAYVQSCVQQVMQTRYQVSEHFICREICGEYVIVPVGEDTRFSNSMISPNHTAGFIWNAFSTPRSIDEVTSLAMEQYDAPEEVIRQDIVRFVQEAKAYNILLEVE